MRRPIFSFFNTWHLKLNKLLKDRSPLLNQALFTFPRMLGMGFQDEWNAAHGNLKAKSDHASIVLFTAHKCASTYTHKLIAPFAEKKGMTQINFDSYFSLVDRGGYQNFEDKTFMDKAFNPNGFFYGPFRSFRKIPSLKNYLVVLILRDPRDVLTSNYYSNAFSHAILSEENIKKRELAVQETVDEFVIRSAPRFQKTYQEYSNLVRTNKHVKVLPYEQMVSSFETWIRELLNYLKLDPTEAEINQLVEASNFTVAKEDKNAHIRNIKAGDHINKLKPETIALLNDTLKEELSFFNYL